ncbi:DNA alkylation repair protein [Mucilaginibacter sp. HMF5004]|uniref:DNA alkylation repair protein n=1 Tax=Mucilaginibacter rivuli TaxID=2857527 RepID=UPI001C5F340F|nr:DNA alkylation repair protein [Mucilaginibacter rivuli]MBW4891957.1 DNA alkylation repair protein [Mucilaginibacter rivuli]
MLKAIIEELQQTEHGFKHITEAGDKLLAQAELNHLQIAGTLINESVYQARMLGTYLLGELTATNIAALTLLKTNVVHDDNWRVQEMLAKAFDSYCKATGYENALPEIKVWLNSKQHNLNRAAIEGLRIWTSRPYFKQQPDVAIKLIAKLKTSDSEYVRKSVGNALHDISKKHKVLVQKEAAKWDLSDPRINFTHKLVVK